MKKIKPGYLILGIFVLLIGLLFASSFLKENNKAVLIENGIETIARISKIDVNNYKANEMEGTYVENYILTFNFSVDGKEIKSIRTIEKRDYAKFFDRGLNVNDSIPVLYDPENPKNNKIKELNLSEN
tara:strand:+ start:157 stop:540 length:384 start_codon:yes stop_codon:yes gene_type:complete